MLNATANLRRLFILPPRMAQYYARMRAVGSRVVELLVAGQYSLAILLTVLIMSPASAVWAVNKIESTQEYLEAYRSGCAFGTAHMEVLRRHKVLLVPGYFSDLDPAYFVDQSHWLFSSGVEHEKVPVKSRQSVLINSSIIATAIRDASKPVILITHSKGSVDTLDALRTEAVLRRKVKGWISLQGAFFGSPVADMLLDETRLNPLVVSVVLQYLGGSREAAQNLTTSAARAYYRDHKPEIDAIVREVPAIAFASVLEGGPSAQARTTLAIPLELMRRQGIRSDGLVPLDAAVLPGMSFVKISGVDHIAPVMAAVQRFDRVRMTKALLLLLKPFREVPPNAATC